VDQPPTSTPAPMSKNIVICCDGTNNQFDGDHTNVLRAFKVAVRSEAQVTFYDPGVGTMPEPWFTTRLGKRWSMIKGLAFGSGFLDNVAVAYCALMHTYEPGDQIFLFGFSRGAYTARAVAGMLTSVGLLPVGTEHLVRYAISYWRKDFGPASPGGKLCAEFKSTIARDCPVHFVGVWDTVGSVGFFNHFRTFPNTYRNSGVSHVRHAVAIDERRCCFRQNLMGEAKPGQDVKNVWFAGVHSDVGGGYLAEQAGLAKIAFAWLMREARACGMGIDSVALDREVNQTGEPQNPAGQIHVSLCGGWWFAELLPTRRYSFSDHKQHWRFSLGRRRDVKRDAAQPFVALHESVLTKMGMGYRPSNLPPDPASARQIFRIET
jgi:uncharacterized protein (DUF2235 family)